MRLRQRFRFGRRLSSAVLAAAMLPPASAMAQEQRYLVLDEIKFGALAHDVAFAGGKEGGADIRSEERRVGKECRSLCDWSSDVCSSDLGDGAGAALSRSRRDQIRCARA